MDNFLFIKFLAHTSYYIHNYIIALKTYFQMYMCISISHHCLIKFQIYTVNIYASAKSNKNKTALHIDTDSRWNGV